MRYRHQIPIKSLAEKQGRFSERQFAKDAGISRAGLRGTMRRITNVELKTFLKCADHLGRDVHVLATSDQTNTDMSTLAVGYKVMTQGFNTWKTHFMNFVDEFRRTLDPQLLLLAPPRELHRELRALLASIVVQLCGESEMDPPAWAEETYFLDRPWFVSGMQSLKASALQESPLAFRRNNIYVLGNFLERR